MQITPEIFLDLIRGPHLLGVVVAMGAAIYFDLRTLYRIAQPLNAADREELHRIHMVVSMALGVSVVVGAMFGLRAFDLHARAAEDPMQLSLFSRL